jgi:hypothetical protein
MLIDLVRLTTGDGAARDELSQDRRISNQPALMQREPYQGVYQSDAERHIA